jgi:hypothetical protein
MLQAISAINGIKATGKTAILRKDFSIAVQVVSVFSQ